MAAPSTWVPHIETFVDSSLPTSEHDASLEAIAALVKKGHVSLLEVVREMEMYLTTNDNTIRLRGTLLLGEILDRIPQKTLDRTAVDSLSDFFISRLADWVALRGTLVGCHALLRRKKEVGSISTSDIKRFSEFFFEEVDVQSLDAKDRKLCYEVLICFCTEHKEVATTQGEDLLYGILRVVDNEMDPSCLMLCFQLAQSAISLFPVLSNTAYQDSFDILSKYFPVYFTHADASNEVTREELSDALLSIFCSTPYFEQHVIPFLLEKLSAAFSLAKLDSLKYLKKCISYYGSDRMADHAEDIWHSLETIIFNKEEDQIAKKALECFEIAVSVLITPIRDTFFGLICQKIDHLLNNIGSEMQAELHALGRIFAIISSVSDYLCTRVFQKYFARLVNTIVESTRSSLNVEALYLVSEILSSCKVLTQRSTDSTEFIIEKESWLNILRGYSDELTAALLKLVNAITSFKEDALMVSQGNVHCAVKCLEVLATFVESYSPISDEIYIAILKSFTLVISDMEIYTPLVKSTQEALIQIGSVAEKYKDQRRAVIYTTMVVEKLLSAFVASLLPLDLSLEVLYGIGTVGKNQMKQVLQAVEEVITVKISKVCLEGEFGQANTLISLLQFYSGRILLWLCDAGNISEVAMQFALRLWNQMENENVSKNIHVMGILDALMMTMKRLVAVSTIDYQSIILQKSYGIIVESVSCSPELFTAYRNLEQLLSSPSSSVQDLNMISLFASVITALTAQTPLPTSNSSSSLNLISNLFLFSLLKGHMPAAQALASIINKNSIENEVFGSCLSFLSEDTAEIKMFLKKDVVLGFAWIGKGLAMRGDDRSKEIIRFLLKLVFSSQHGLDIALSAADGLHVIMGHTEDCLTKQFHAVIKPLYKQRLFSTLLPVLLSSMNEATYKEVVCRALGHIISDAPLAAVIGEARKILPAVANSIIVLSTDIQNKDIVYSLLLVLSGIFMDSTGKESIIENLHIVIGVLTRLVSYPHLMVVRETAIQCLASMSTLPHSKIYPVKSQVLKAVTSALDDKRRIVRQEAVRCRQAWSKGIDYVSGVALLRDPRHNKGLAFTEKERDAHYLHGLLPPAHLSQDLQEKKLVHSIRQYQVPLQRYMALMDLQERNERLFYKLLVDNVEEFLPVVYTPTVGEACQKYGSIFRRPQGLYISIKDKIGKILEVLKNWHGRSIQVTVVTDGERILGLGDLGCQGMGIPVGKLALYTALGGIRPSACLPITIDVGTNNEELLKDEFYIGLKQKRVVGQEYKDFLHEFVTAVKQNYGEKVLIQFEDFANHNAFDLLFRYCSTHLVFNDDIQGTSAVVLAGIVAALNFVKGSLPEYKFLFLGAGEAGTGIAELIVFEISKQTNAPLEEARKKIWLLDSKGLIVNSRIDSLQHFKKPWAHEHEPVNNLLDAIKAIKPTVLIGSAGIGQTFTQEVIETMASINENPVILALSNPTTQSECTAGQAYAWSKGRAIFASGSPFGQVKYNGKVYIPGQANNAYIFPGFGLGLVISGAIRVHNEMLLAVAEALAHQVTRENFDKGLIYPPFTNIREISAHIAANVAAKAYELGLATRLPRPKDLVKYAKSCMYSPVYRSYG